MILCTLVAGLLPLKLLRYLRHSAAHASSSKQHKHVSLILCLLTCFSGGVFLATCFLHLFPELVENLEKLDQVSFYVFVYSNSKLVCGIKSVYCQFIAGKILSFRFMISMSIIQLLNYSAVLGFSYFSSWKRLLQFLKKFYFTHFDMIDNLRSPLAVQENGCCMTGGFMTTTSYESHVMASPRKDTSWKIVSYHIYLVDGTEDPMLSSVRRDVSLSDDNDISGHCQKHCPLTVHHVRHQSGRETPECNAPSEVCFIVVIFVLKYVNIMNSSEVEN
uniref:Vomeronasal type-2 receptor 26 n=1 Tax=Heterorhabditis bacteriophora TaxID=37862 RepID=A0A1I7WVJ6_HETBA